MVLSAQTTPFTMSVLLLVKQIVAVMVVALVLALAAVSGELVVGFYKETCPRAEALVQQSVFRAYVASPGIAPGIIRLLYHDCFVEVHWSATEDDCFRPNLE